MRILIANDGMNAHYFERVGWMNAFLSMGIETVMYDCKSCRAFDVFDIFNPDIFIGQLYNLDRQTIKCINERPHMKYALRAGEFPKNSKPEILSVDDNQLMVLDGLIKSNGGPAFIYTHYLQEDIENTHELFRSKFGIPLLGVPMAADMAVYPNGERVSALSCDIGYVGGYWPYKGQVLDRYLTSMVNRGTYNVKIFGNQPWRNTPYYCGVLDETLVPSLFKSAAICPNFNEPHAHDIDSPEMNERPFKVLAAGGFCITDNIRVSKKIFGDNIVYTDSPQDFADKVDYYLHNPDERIAMAQKGFEYVKNNHTYKHRMLKVLELFGENHPC